MMSFLRKLNRNVPGLFRIITFHGVDLRTTECSNDVICEYNLAKFGRHFHSTSTFSRKKVREGKLEIEDFSYTSPKKKKKVIVIWPNMTVEELSRAMGKTVEDVFELMTFVDNTVCYKTCLDIIGDWNTLCDIITKANFRWKVGSKPKKTDQLPSEKDIYPCPAASEEELQKRPPVVTIMGHVDHGKTTLLDYLRKSSIVSKEFGGITQHIGAFSVVVRSNSITFLDTPGHAAFSAMRSRGAHCTDIVVLVVAADDGVMEQTVESIKMAKSAQVPIVVAINKIDKPDADIERTKKMLMLQGLELEEFGGDVQAVPISALNGINITQLTEAIIVQSELADLKAPYSGLVEGIVIESKLDRYRGKLSTALIRRGTLEKGCVLTAGMAWCKVKAMYDDRNQQIVRAPPSTPVEIVGWQNLPIPGDVLSEVESEKRAHEVMRFRQKRNLLQKAMSDLPTIENTRAQNRTLYKEKLVEKRKTRHARVRQDESRKTEVGENANAVPQLYIIIKSDVEGSLEALTDILRTYRYPLCELNVVHSGVGNVSLTDVQVAETFHALVYGFNVSVLPEAETYAARNHITVKHQNIIYRFLDDIKNEINKRIPPKEVEEVIGEAIVLELFLITEDRKKKIPVAGCRCTKGELKKSSLYKVIRKDQELFRGTLSSMRNLKTEVTSIRRDQHCGLKFEDSTVLFEPGDIIQAYKIFHVPQEVEWNPF